MGNAEIDHKLRWTYHHLKILDDAVSLYIDPDNIRFSPQRYNDTHTEVWGKFESILDPDTPIILSHIFGDVIQSANSCLDYLVCELFVRHNPGEVAKPLHKFPLVTSHSAFNEKIGSGCLYGIPFEAVAVIEGLQPYKGRTDPVPADLLALRHLTNTHKHRKLHLSVLTASPAPSDPSALFEENGELFAMAKDLPKAVHFKAEFGPFTLMDEQHVHVNRQYSAVVVLEESGFREELITIVAERLCRVVNIACQRLDLFLE